MYQLHYLNIHGNYPKLLEEPNITEIEDSFGYSFYACGIIQFQKMTDKNVCITIYHHLSHYNKLIRLRGKVKNRLNHWQQLYDNLKS